MTSYKYTSCGSVNKFDDAMMIGHALPIDSEFIAWLAEGNTPEPYVPPAPTQAELNAPHLKYLQDTDWMIVRFAETSGPIPAEIVSMRAAARLAVA